MPSRLRPTAPVATDAILVGDPGRALLLAQELLEQPRMSNHARGLWGYSGKTPAGRELTIQATGMGGPSAAIVLADLAKLGVRRAIRVGTCTGLAAEVRAGDLVLVAEAVAGGGSAAAFGVELGDSVLPDPELFGRLRESLGVEASAVRITSLDAHPVGPAPAGGNAAAADLQTVAVLARSRELEVAAAALLIVSEAGGTHLDDDELESASKRAGVAARNALSQPKVEG
jgi:purine-nucleoside phosphorylase